MIFSKKTPREIINQYKLFYIPYYQREYVWEGRNNSDSRTTYNKFILDIANEYFENPSSKYFIGNLAFNYTNITEVVDGQQRITTLVLLLCILADNFCSEKIKMFNQSVVYDNSSNFIIQEEQYLTNEIEGTLSYKKYPGTDYKIELDKAVSRTIDLINRYYGNKSVPEFDGLYSYILDNVEAIIIEFNHSKDALRYFLNINSFSIKLTPDEIFLTILSQALKISRNNSTIYDLKKQLISITNRFEKIKTNDMIKIFLNSYYKNDKDINEINSLDVGKWMAYFHYDVYSQFPEANSFCINFIQYLIDIEKILTHFQAKNHPLDRRSPIFLTYSLLKYQNYDDLVQILLVLFKNRHNYSNANIFDTSKNISITILEDLAKRINLTIIHNYLRDSTSRLDLLHSNIEIDYISKQPILSIQEIIMNIKASVNNIFSLTYMRDPQSNPKPQLKDKSRTILVVLALQQSLLSFKVDNTNSFFAYVDYIINSGNFTIEHLYSIKEYSDNSRKDNWINYKNKFKNSQDFDNVRALFENLTLLNKSSNSSANDSMIYDKFVKYKNAHDIFGYGDEFLVQSLVDGSNYYLNPKILSLVLPERKLTNVKQNTWEHSITNRPFIIKLIEMALDELN